MVTAVSEALARGWSVVPFSVELIGGRRRKTPLVDPVPYQARVPTEDEVAEWCDMWPDASWGVITGAVSGVVVVGFDGPAGRAMVDRWHIRPHVETPSGGAHWYARHPGWTIQTLPAVLPGQGLDIRGDTGDCAAIYYGPGWRVVRALDDLDSVSVMPESGRLLCGLEQATQRMDDDAPAPDLQAVVASSIGHGQEGAARVYAALHRGRMIYDHGGRQWYSWGGHAWQRDGIDMARAGLSQVRDLYADTMEARAVTASRVLAGLETGDPKAAVASEHAARAAVKSLEASVYQAGVLTIAAAAHHGMAITGEEWDREPYLLAVPNGTVDLRSGAFRDGSPHDMIRTCAATPWQGITAPRERWERFIREIFRGELELAEFTRLLVGWSMIGEQREHLLPILYGPQGRNGKTTLLSTLARVLGDGLAAPIKSEVIMHQRITRASSSADPDLARLRGLRLAWCSELAQGGRLDAPKVKGLVGGDRMVARELYSREQTWTPTHHLWIICNDLPRIPEQDSAMWERCALIPFSARFVSDPGPGEYQADPELGARLADEAPGILAWCVQACLDYQRCSPLCLPDAVRQATAAYRQDQDTIAEWIAACAVECGPGGETQASMLWRSYVDHFTKEGGGRLPKKAWSQALGAKYRQSRNNNGQSIYVGLALRNEI